MSLFVLAAGCAETGESRESPPDAVSAFARGADVESAISDDRDVCSLLPSCGPCSLACDPEKLAEEYVPKGTCALYQCTLSDGSTLRIDVCNYGDDCTARLDRAADPACAGVKLDSAPE